MFTLYLFVFCPPMFSESTPTTPSMNEGRVTAFPLPTGTISTPGAMEGKCKAQGHLPISSTAQSRSMDLNFKFMSIDNTYIIFLYF